MALRSNLPSPGFDSSYRVYGEIFSICFVFRSSNSSCITEFFPSFIRLKKKQAFSVHLGSSPALYQLILRTGPKFYQIRVEVLGEFLFVFRRYLLACWERLLKRLCWRNGHAYRQWGQVRAWWSMVLAWTHRRRCRSIGDRLLHRSGVGVFFFYRVLRTEFRRTGSVVRCVLIRRVSWTDSTWRCSGGSKVKSDCEGDLEG